MDLQGLLQRLKFKTQIFSEDTINKNGINARINESRYLDWMRSRTNLNLGKRMGDI